MQLPGSIIAVMPYRISKNALTSCLARQAAAVIVWVSFLHLSLEMEPQQGLVAHQLVLGTIQELFVPSHLNGLQLSFVRLLWIVFEVGQLGYVLMKVGEADFERIDVRMSFREKNTNIFSVVPG